MELGGVKEDDDPIGSRGLGRGDEARDPVVVQVDHARFRSGLEGQELRDPVRARICRDR